MGAPRIARRAFLRTAGMVIGAGVATRGHDATAQAVAAPNSSGTAAPRLVVPANACDSHIHIYDPARFAMAPSRRVPPDDATLRHYRLMQQRIGTSRAVVVTPRNYGIDNDVTVDALRQMRPRARGVAVVDPSVTDADLVRMNDAGVRGIRFSLNDPATAVVSFDMVEPLAHRVAELGWHVQFHLDGAQIVEREAWLRRLPGIVVFDHLGRPPAGEGVKHASHGIVRDLLAAGRAWVKLSGFYLDSAGPPYRDAVPVALSLVRAAPDRVVWGSDWPHPTELNDRKPDDAVLLDLLLEAVPDDAARRKVLVENPALLYGFDSTR